jgi:SAM-dependent methyltransferase
MADRLFADRNLAALYDFFAPPGERSDFRFYLPMVMAANSVLDIGCGTGALLRMARDAGHPGWLCGLDPAEGMLAQARKRKDIEWVHGDLSSASWDREFELIVMTGHAFQVLIEDDQLRQALAAVRSALTVGGRFAFETRNPLAREWERWPSIFGKEATGPDGPVVRMECEVEIPVEGDIVRFSHTFTSQGWPKPEVSRSVLRFLDAATLDSFLAEAGLTVDERHGDWDRSPLTAGSPEIITVARRTADSR